MSKQHKLTKRIERLENQHRRDMVRLKKELLSAIHHAAQPVSPANGLWVDGWRRRPKLADVEPVEAEG